MSEIQLLSFDLDDTLWPCKPTIVVAEKTLYQYIQHHVPVITKKYSYEALTEKRIVYLNQRPELQHDLSALRIEFLKSLADELNIDNQWVNNAFEVFYNARQKVKLYSDVTDTLNKLSQSFRLVAVTNGNASIVKTGIARWFEFSVSASDVGNVKPHPAIFQSVMHKANCKAGEILHIGDDQHNDVYGAYIAGIRTVWLNRENINWSHKDCVADFHIRSLSELPSLLAKLKA